MVCSELSLDVVAISFGLSVEILVPVSSSKGLHVLHPKMVSVGTDRANGLLERELDFEPQAVELDDIEWIEGEITGHQDALPPCRMIDEDEPYEDSHGSPEQVERAEAQRDILLSIDRALSRLHGRRVGEQRAQDHLLAIPSRTTPSTRPLRWSGSAVIGNSIGSYPSEQMIALTQ